MVKIVSWVCCTGHWCPGCFFTDHGHSNFWERLVACGPTLSSLAYKFLLPRAGDVAQWPSKHEVLGLIPSIALPPQKKSFLLPWVWGSIDLCYRPSTLLSMKSPVNCTLCNPGSICFFLQSHGPFSYTRTGFFHDNNADVIFWLVEGLSIWTLREG